MEANAGARCYTRCGIFRSLHRAAVCSDHHPATLLLDENVGPARLTAYVFAFVRALIVA